MSVKACTLSLVTAVLLFGGVVQAAPPLVSMFSPLQQASFLREILRHLMNTDTSASAVAENTADIARSAGYFIEEHFVETSDGYILTMHHIPPQANPNRRYDVPPRVTVENIVNSHSISNTYYNITSGISNHNTDNGDISTDEDTETNERVVEDVSSKPSKSSSTSYGINGIFNNFLNFFTLGGDSDDSTDDTRHKRQVPTVNEHAEDITYQNQISRGVIFLQHGLMGSSDNWNTNNEEDCLAYLLSDAGFDVWMGNFRGNIYSRNHTTLTHNDPEFWRFSFDEMAKYDLPAMLDYVLDQTGVEKVQYIGHSMGTTTFFALMSSQPSYQEKVSSMIALAPVATLRNIQSPIKYLAPLVNEIHFILRMFGSEQEIMTNRMMISLWDPYNVCNNHDFCENLQFIITGFDPKRADEKMVPMILSHNPAGASTQTLFHFAQGVDSGNFAMFDHGIIQNRKRYGQDKPPLYNVSNIALPITLFHGKSDWLTGTEDIQYLENTLPNLVASHQVLNPTFSHLDFLWARDARNLVYDNILDILNR